MNMSYLVQQLSYQLPVLLVCLVGFVLAFMFLRSYPSAFILMALGTGLLVLTGVAVVVVQAYLRQQQEVGQWTNAKFAELMFLVGTAGSVGRAVGTALVIAAAFVGRGDSVPLAAEVFDAPFRNPRSGT
jgi:hypothetical protein